MNDISNLYELNNKFLLGANTKWLVELRKNLLTEILKEGTPNKKKEIWKYSNLNHINNIKYCKLEDSEKKLLKFAEEENNTVNVFDGKYFIPEKIRNNQKISINKLSESIEHFKNYFFFNKNIFNNDFTTNLNTIFLTDGLSLSINENENMFIQINYKNFNDNITGYIRNIIKVCNNSKLTLVENFIGTESSNNDLNIFDNFWLEKNAQVDHIILQNYQYSSNIIYSSLIFSYENSKFNQLSFQSGCNSVKNSHTTNLMGQNSSANHHGVYFGRLNQYIDNKTSVIHHKENCQSNQIYKGILNNDSTGVYLSNTLVKPEAQKTKGYQLSRGMLLSDKCKINTKPQLEIYADDVKCSHGSTVGAIDKNQLFYLQSRGINKKNAENILIKAFCMDVLKIIENKDIKEKLENLIDGWLLQN